MLKRFGLNALLMYPDDGGAGSAGGMGGDAGNGGSNAGGDAGAGNNSGNGANGGTAEVGPEWARGWEGVETELLSDPSLKAIQNPAALLKSYVHGQRMQGRDKVILPGKNSTKEEIDQFWQKVGVPLEADKYGEGIKFDKEKHILGEDLHKEFLATAHGLRVLPDQAAKLYDFFNEKTKGSNERSMAQIAEAHQNGLNELQAKLGVDAYKVRLAKATNFIKEHSPEFFNHLGKSGLGKDPAVVSALMDIAEKFTKESDLPPGSDGMVKTVDELQQEINTMMGDLKGPYHTPSHPDHSRQVNHMLALQTKLEKALQRG